MNLMDLLKNRLFRHVTGFIKSFANTKLEALLFCERSAFNHRHHLCPKSLVQHQQWYVYCQSAIQFDIYRNERLCVYGPQGHIQRTVVFMGTWINTIRSLCFNNKINFCSHKVLINFCYCALLSFSKIVQGIIFGSLRVVEYQVFRISLDICSRIRMQYDVILVLSIGLQFYQAHKGSILEFHIPQIHIYIRCAQFGKCQRRGHVVRMVFHYRFSSHTFANLQRPFRIC